MRDLWQDLRYGARSMRRHALLSAVIVATLTLGIGVSAGVFTYYNAEFLRARVDKDFDSFVRVYAAYARDPARPGQPGGATLADYLAFRDQAESLRNVAAYAQVESAVGEDDPTPSRVLLVTANFFPLYDLERPLMGRLLSDEDCAAANPVIVLSERLWRNHFAADPEIVGKVVHVNGCPLTVVGVTPTFAGMVNGARAWMPYTLASTLKFGDGLRTPGEAAWLRVEGRLNAGFSRRDAAEELNLIASQQDRLYPERKTTLTVTDGSSIQEPGNGNTLTWAVTLIFGAVTLFVLIVCVNVTTLLLSRAAARRHEIAVRLALGARRVRLIRMLLTETLLQATVAGVASLYVAYHLPAALRQWLINSRGDLADTWSVAPDWRAFAYLTAVTLLAGTLAGLTPALQSLKVNLSESLKSRHGLPGRAGSKSRLHGALIGAQVALSFFLLWWIGIAVRGYQNTATFDPGYETRHVLFARLWTPAGASEPRASWETFHRTVAERFQSLPGVEAVAYANREPFNDGRLMGVQAPGRESRMVAYGRVSPNFFSALGIPILSGRALGETDPAGGNSGCRAVVSQTLAREFWPGENPLGQTLRGPAGEVFEVVGVARDVSTQRLGGPDDPMMYLPWDPTAYPHDAYVRFSGDAAGLARAAVPMMREINPGVSVEARTIQAMADWHLVDLGRMVTLVIFLGAAAVLLAIIGIYGVVAFAVTQRTKEMGIRIALGARAGDIYGAIIRGHVWPIAAGLLIGVAFTAATVSAAAQVLRGQPFILRVSDPVVYFVVAATLAAASLAAMLIPARRATRVEPAAALRCE